MCSISSIKQKKANKYAAFYYLCRKREKKMGQKEPIELALKLLDNLKIVRHNEHRYISSDFGFVNSFVKMETTLFSLGQPYRIKEGRIAFVNQGSARILINLIEYTIQPGYIAVIAPNSIIQITEVSPDFDMQMIAADHNFLPISGKTIFFLPSPSSEKHHIVTISTRTATNGTLFHLDMGSIAGTAIPQRSYTTSLASLIYYLEYIAQNSIELNSAQLTRQEEIFQRFISLVNVYSKKERNVNFYADKLCLTPRYLNTVIRQASQQTVMDWINQSIILEAKVLLKHSNLLVYQVSDELNFPNPSFFSKFFKRMTGMTPHEYQQTK